MKAHQHAAVARDGQESQALGQSRGGFSTKIHANQLYQENQIGLSIFIMIKSSIKKGILLKDFSTESRNLEELLLDMIKQRSCSWARLR